METRRWINQGQPQTMQIAVFLLYFNAVFTLLLGSDSALYVLLGIAKLGVTPTDGLETLIKLVIGFGGAGAAYLIANEQKWGYRLGVVVAALPLVGVLMLMLLPRMNHVPRYGLVDFSLINLLIEGALFALLVHPQSRDYERIWFK
ncbi:MAG TPA: hypothetical protein VFB78_12545 [Acidimicrobiales bacterium]|nr:hypothetical protein [Acidimicrobiales bacterium]